MTEGHLSNGIMTRVLRGYLWEIRQIVSHPWSFPERLGLDDTNTFARGLWFLLFSCGGVFILLVPVYLHYGKSPLAALIALVSTGLLFLAGLVFHLAVKILGGEWEVPVGRTMGIYNYLLGIQQQGFIILSYPLLWVYGPVPLAGGNDAEKKALLQLISQEPTLYFINYAAALLVGLNWVILAVIPMFLQFYDFQSFGKTRVVVAMAITGVAGSQLLGRVVPILHQMLADG